MNCKVFITLIISLNIYSGFNSLCIENIDLYKQNCYSHNWKSFIDNTFLLEGSA